MKKYNLSKIMKMAWTVCKKAKVSFSSALKFAWSCAKKEVELIKRDGWRSEGKEVEFKFWMGYGHIRFYYTCPWLRKYQNNKKTNFVEYAA